MRWVTSLNFISLLWLAFKTDVIKKLSKRCQKFAQKLINQIHHFIFSPSEQKSNENYILPTTWDCSLLKSILAGCTESHEEKILSVICFGVIKLDPRKNKSYIAPYRIIVLNYNI